MAGNRRLQKEYSELQSSPIEGASVELVSDSSLNKWQGVLHGPAASPYAGGKFKFTLEFPLEYPFKAPQLKIVSAQVCDCLVMLTRHA
ncbi:uncharacterized protein L969DRAFT_86072 [Mixia osmundae IAM 14324]|uniref:uncharacterized protein n=1 Tax=Mixia osmundae (strain CBS 9802 / IAM 14324 / JCM 22182 / KY 12970) TaxID=764103 RepID=UPI0004A55645|nr:uncharacterized protein L969DRAFT_86072 [Mixia osmundae IAM 14324]KEI40834.1 hypothetical protein L969DRAFT_86072 [Mixia osmundae IAM 14324]